MTPKPNLARRSLWAVFIANAIFGFSFIFTRVALESTAPFVLLSCRFFIALVFFTIILFATKAKITLRGKPWKLLLLLGVFQPVLYFLGETYGVLYTSATFSSIMIALIPIFTIFASAIFLKESPTLGQTLFCWLSVLGVIFITFKSAGGANQLVGALLLLMAVVADVLFYMISRKTALLFTAFERTYIMFFMGFFVFFGLMLTQTGGSLAPFVTAMTTPSLRFPIFYLGIASSVLAFFLINYANTYMPVTRTIVFVNVTTLVTVLVGVIFLKESLSPLSYVAAGMIVVGVWGVQHFARPEEGPDEELEELLEELLPQAPPQEEL